MCRGHLNKQGRCFPLLLRGLWPPQPTVPHRQVLPVSTKNTPGASRLAQPCCVDPLCTVPFSSQEQDGCHHLPLQELLPLPSGAASVTGPACHVLVHTSAAPRWRWGPALPPPRGGDGNQTCLRPTRPRSQGQPWPRHCASRLRSPINPINHHPTEVLVRPPRNLPWQHALCSHGCPSKGRDVAGPLQVKTLHFSQLHK